MAQSALTVTPPGPTPPTNFSCTGATGPNPPNYTRGTYANPVSTPPPYFDDGTAGPLVSFAANAAALAGGTSAADNAGSAPGFIGTAAGGAGGTGVNSTVSNYGSQGTLVPAATSAAAEGAGTETLFTQTYSTGIYNPNGPLQATGTGPAATQATRDAGPNGSHASSLSPATNPAITGLVPASTASGTGTIALTVNGTNFTKQSVVLVNGVAQTTVYVSPTQLTVAAAPKRATAGTLPVTVVTGGVITTAPTNWTFT